MSSQDFLHHRLHQAGRQLGDNRPRRDTKGRFTAVGSGAVAFGAAGTATFAGMVAAGAHQDAHRVPELAPELRGVRNKWGGVALGGAALSGAALYAHGHLSRSVGRTESGHVVSKGLKDRLNNATVTGEQARHAGVFGQVGTGVGVVTGAAVGAGVGAAVHKPGQGAGIGAAVGGAVGGSGGAGLGLYVGRPRKKRKPLNGTAPLAKRNDLEERGASAGVAAGVGIGGGHAVGALASSASHRLRNEAAYTSHLADYKKKVAQARMLEDTSRFHNSVKGKVGVGVAGAAVGYAAMHRRQQHRTLTTPGPEQVAKVSDENKTKLARAGLIGAQVADVAAIKSAFHETKTATKPVTEGMSAARKVGAMASYGSKKAALPVVAGGLVASVGAERVMHHQQQKLATQQARQARTTP